MARRCCAIGLRRMSAGKPKIEWSETLSIGVPEIDEQHHAFIGLVDRFRALDPDDPCPEALRGILADVMDYAVVHFMDEERVMRETGYPGLAAHAAKHHAAATRVQALLARDSGRVERYRFLATFLRRWLLSHILDEDKAFGRWFAANCGRASAAPAEPAEAPRAVA